MVDEQAMRDWQEARRREDKEFQESIREKERRFQVRLLVCGTLMAAALGWFGAVVGWLLKGWLDPKPPTGVSVSEDRR